MFIEQVKTEGLAHLSYVVGSAGSASVVDPQQNKKLLFRVCEGYRNLFAAKLYLGDLESRHGNYEAALEHYRAAHEHAPARIPPLRCMLTAYQQLLMQREYDQVKQQIRERESRVRELIG